jgi:hypothetical protein
MRAPRERERQNFFFEKKKKKTFSMGVYAVREGLGI